MYAINYTILIFKGKKKGKLKKKKKQPSRPPSPVYVEIQVLLQLLNEFQFTVSDLRSKHTKRTFDFAYDILLLLFQKIIQSYVRTPILHCYFGTLNPTNIDMKLNYLYFIRKTSSLGKQQNTFAALL